MFPLLVLILNRAGKRGRLAVLLLTAALGYGIVDAVLTLAPRLPLSDLAHSCPWYVFLFGMGVCAGSVASATRSDDLGGQRKWLGATAASLVLLAVLLALFAWRNQESELSRYFPLIDAATGAFTANLLIVLGVGNATGAGRLRRALSSWPLVRAGTWAYSLYLLHFPLLRLLAEGAVKPLLPDAGRIAHFGLLMLIGVPFVLLASWAFFQGVERPFLSRTRAGSDEDARRAALSPAP